MKSVISKLIKYFCQVLIMIYQNVISPYISPSCRYYPTCSSYAKQAINEFGIKGMFLTLKRILKCNPFFAGGYDPIPQNKVSQKIKSK